MPHAFAERDAPNQCRQAAKAPFRRAPVIEMSSRCRRHGSEPSPPRRERSLPVLRRSPPPPALRRCPRAPTKRAQPFQEIHDVYRSRYPAGGPPRRRRPLPRLPRLAARRRSPRRRLPRLPRLRGAGAARRRRRIPDDLRFADDATLAAWAHSASRQAWLERGQGLFDEPRERRAHGLAAWFDDNRKPPRWKQSVAIWLAFFPVSLAFNLGAGPYLGELSLAARVLLSTLVLTPLMTYWFIPLSSRLLAPGCTAARSAPPACRKRTRRLAAHPGGVGRSAGLCPTGSVGYPASIRFPSPAVRVPWRQPRS